MTDRPTPPRDVVVIATDGDAGDAIGSAIADGTATAVDVVASVADATDGLGFESPVGCVVVVDSTDLDVERACRSCRDADPDVPIVVVVTSTDDATGPPTADDVTEVPAADDVTEVPTVDDVTEVQTTDDEARREQTAVETLTAVGDVRIAAGADPDAVVDHVASAITTYERRARLCDDATMLRSFLADIGVSLYVKDREGHHVRMSNVPGARNPQDVLGKRDTDVYPDSAGAEQSLEDDLRVVGEDTVIYGREEHVETDAGQQWLRTNKAPWRDERGRIRGVVGLTWDVTDEMENQQRLAEREEMFETFAKSLSHDVRTPLQVARGNLELLRDDVDDAAPVDRADAALERIGEMVDDLQVVAKDEPDEPPIPEPETADERDDAATVVTEPISIRQVSRRVWNVIGTGDATLEVEFGEDAVVYADEATLRPLLENLFTNAIRHGGDGVTVRIGHVETGGIFVEDDGPGIPADQRQKVTNEGFTTIEDGTGTGFSIISGIVTRNEWDLEITESARGGARVEIHGCVLVADPPPDDEPGERIGLGESDDVGDVGEPGTAEYDGQHNRWIVAGAGRNVWHQVNEFQFLHVPVDGPVRIDGRIEDFDHKSQYSKAGFMIRDDLAEDATYGYVGTAAGERTEVLWRNQRGDDGVSQQLEGVPGGESWYRVERRGEVVTTFVSGDGEEWTPLDQRRVDVTDPVEVGLVVCSHMPQTLARATFADVTVRRLPDD